MKWGCHLELFNVFIENWIRFELFRYRPAFADPRGRRFEDQGVHSLDLRDLEMNQRYWDGITQSYRVVIPLPAEALRLKEIVLQVTFTTESDYRLRDVLVLKRGR